ncbi:hypothetical protein Naga_101383g1 [Nannochloropsis gaditana]|uniref:Uncharacterized protein n=1 Tax=Nannochloropsis gaditana TaxID=72520 RepID=W7U7N6_9STRA|nr:hypothetical protein Naga_101383g1 [Nannochloropsis gaditana]
MLHTLLRFPPPPPPRPPPAPCAISCRATALSSNTCSRVSIFPSAWLPSAGRTPVSQGRERGRGGKGRREGGRERGRKGRRGEGEREGSRSELEDCDTTPCASPISCFLPSNPRTFVRPNDSSFPPSLLPSLPPSLPPCQPPQKHELLRCEDMIALLLFPPEKLERGLFSVARDFTPRPGDPVGRDNFKGKRREGPQTTEHRREGGTRMSTSIFCNRETRGFSMTCKSLKACSLTPTPCSKNGPADTWKRNLAVLSSFPLVPCDCGPFPFLLSLPPLSPYFLS